MDEKLILEQISTVQDKVRLIVTLKGNFRPEHLISSEEVVAQRMQIDQRQKQFIDSLKDFFPLQEKTFATIPVVAIEVNKVVLEKILQNPLVENITLDEPFFVQPSNPLLLPTN